MSQLPSNVPLLLGTSGMIRALASKLPFVIDAAASPGIYGSFSKYNCVVRVLVPGAVILK